jgi:hypothetical protein
MKPKRDQSILYYSLRNAIMAMDSEISVHYAAVLAKIAIAENLALVDREGHVYLIPNGCRQ